MIIMKFGGTSIGTAPQIRKVAEIIASQLSRKPLIVVSALSGVTNQLIEQMRAITEGTPPNLSELILRHHVILKELGLPEHALTEELEELQDLFKGVSLLQECTDRTKDRILAFGEYCSSKILNLYLQTQARIPSQAICSFDLGLRTDSCFGKATPLPSCYLEIKKAIEENAKHLIVTTGFIAKDKEGNITTLGRNGSDYSASIFGAAVDAEEIQIWTDVNGVLTADPRIVQDAKPVTEMSFEEASELAYYGAKVIHPTSIVPAMKKNIPVRILNTNYPEGKGTIIYHNRQQNEEYIKSIASRSGLTIINIASTRMLAQHGFLANIFNIFSRHNVVVDTVSTSEVSVSVTTEHSGDLTNLLSELKAFSEVSLERGQSIISIVGEGVRGDMNVLNRVFSTLKEHQIPTRMISLGASKINLSLIVDTTRLAMALNILHEDFFS